MDKYAALIARIEKYVKTYVAFELPEIALPIALWIIGTHCFQMFDSFAYLVITSNTKRSGKTRLSEIISFAASNPLNFSAMTPSTLFRVINPADDANDEERKAFIPPTIVFDEAESLSSEAAGTTRSVLNAGYRKGQTVPRTVGKEVVHFRVYCPKVFILIGDVFDTLRDRSIIINMKRAQGSELPQRFIYSHAQAEGQAIREEIQNILALDHEGHNPLLDVLATSYLTQRADFLSDRDEEIWLPLFALCEVFADNRMRELKRTATDLAALKTADKIVYKDLDVFEKKSQQFEMAERAAKDLSLVMGTAKAISSADAVARMRELDLSPWRGYTGAQGLTQHNLGDLLGTIGLPTVNIRFGHKVLKGYRRIDVDSLVNRSSVAQKTKGGKA